MTLESDEERHARKMKAKKAARDKILATKTIEKGLLIVHTGKGKGKTTAAMGLVTRALGQGLRVGIVQFVKGVWDTGERYVLEKFSDSCVIKAMGEGFTWDTQDLERDKAAAKNALNFAREMIADRTNDMILLDELNIVLRYGYVSVEEVLEIVKSRGDMQHVIITGRNAREELIEEADLVTEMTQIKHPFRSGVKAQKGVEF